METRNTSSVVLGVREGHQPHRPFSPRCPFEYALGPNLPFYVTNRVLIGHFFPSRARRFPTHTHKKKRATAVSAGVGGVRDALAAGICSVGKSSSGLKG